MSSCFLNTSKERPDYSPQTVEDSRRPIFHRGAVIAWARSIGVPDDTALSFIQKAGALVIEDNQTAKG